jgi:hypothetical protein
VKCCVPVAAPSPRMKTCNSAADSRAADLRASGARMQPGNLR